MALEGRRSDALAVHAPADVPGAAAAVTAYLSRPGAARPARAAARARPATRRPSGWLVLLGDRPASDLDTIAAERVAPLLSLELMLEAQVRRARDEAGRSDLLPSDGPPWVVLFARQSEPDDGRPTREEVRSELRFRFAARRLALRGTSESLELRAIAALEPGDPDGRRIAARVAEFLGRGRSPSRARSPRRPSAPPQEATARATLEAVERLAEPPQVARADRLPAYRLLGALGNLPDDRIQAATLLEPLAAGRPASVRERLSTLRAVLDHGRPARRPRRSESTATPSRTGSATSRPSRGGIWAIRTSGWPSRWRFGSCNLHNERARSRGIPPVRAPNRVA